MAKCKVGVGFGVGVGRQSGKGAGEVAGGLCVRDVLGDDCINTALGIAGQTKVAKGVRYEE